MDSTLLSSFSLTLMLKILYYIFLSITRDYLICAQQGLHERIDLGRKVGDERYRKIDLCDLVFRCSGPVIKIDVPIEQLDIAE